MTSRRGVPLEPESRRSRAAGNAADGGERPGQLPRRRVPEDERREVEDQVDQPGVAGPPEVAPIAIADLNLHGSWQSKNTQAYCSLRRYAIAAHAAPSDGEADQGRDVRRAPGRWRVRWRSGPGGRDDTAAQTARCLDQPRQHLVGQPQPAGKGERQVDQVDDVRARRRAESGSRAPGRTGRTARSRRRRTAASSQPGRGAKPHAAERRRPSAAEERDDHAGRTACTSAPWRSGTPPSAAATPA